MAHQKNTFKKGLGIGSQSSKRVERAEGEYSSSEDSIVLERVVGFKLMPIKALRVIFFFWSDIRFAEALSMLIYSEEYEGFDYDGVLMIQRSYSIPSNMGAVVDYAKMHGID